MTSDYQQPTGDQKAGWRRDDALRLADEGSRLTMPPEVYTAGRANIRVLDV